MTTEENTNELTPNQKAATYIGWEPTNCACDILPHTICANEAHDKSAPDMSKPENYMRALEALPKAYLWHLGRYPYGQGYCRILRDGAHPFDTIEHPTPAKSLAALYDAEHLNGK